MCLGRPCPPGESIKGIPIVTNPLLPRIDEIEISEVHPTPVRQRRAVGANVFLLLTLALVIPIITHGISKGEFDYNVDESQHAASGIFFASLTKDLPIAHPVQYAYAYYAQYPALSGVIHWPPIFYVTEGIVFRLFGASVATARLTILLFAILGCVFWFRLVNNIQGKWAAALSTIVFALLPSVLLFEKAVMLEIPCLAVSIAALYFWYEYLTTERIRALYWFAVMGGGALLVKQNAIFLVAVCTLSALLLGKWRLFLNRRVLGPLAILIVLVAPFYTVVAVMHWKTIAMDLTGHGMANVEASARPGHPASLLFYIRALPEQLGWPLLVLAAAGIACCRWWSQRTASIFMACWIAGCYITFTAISHKEPRYALCWIPPLIYFVVGPLTAKWREPAIRVAARALALVILVSSVIVGARYERPYLSGYAPVAHRIVETSDSGVILFEARLPANFIFFLRDLDPNRRYLVLRKALWSARIKTSGGVEEFAKTPDDVRDVMEKNGVKYIVTSDQPSVFQADSSLHEVLQHDPQYELVDAFPIESNAAGWKGMRLLLYRNRLPAQPTGKFLHIRMMTLSHDIVLPWSQFRQVW